MAALNDNLELGNCGEVSSEQLLSAQVHVWNHTFSLVNAMSLNCAIQLRIPDTIHQHGSPMTLSQLVHALPIHKAKSQFIYRLMRLLVHSKFFIKLGISKNSEKKEEEVDEDEEEEEEEEERYWLTPSSRLLLRDAPDSIAPLALFLLDPILVKPWHNMSAWLLGEYHGTSFEMTHGRPVWEYMGQESGMSNMLNEAMSCDSRLVMPILLKDYKHMFEEVELVVDVGGGTGMAAKEILNAFPGMNCIVLDLPHVVAGLESTNNLSFVGGDMFESIPHGDVVFLKWMLHNWSDEHCAKILKNCKEAISGKNKRGGKLIIVDAVLDADSQGDNKYKVNEQTQLQQLMFDMNMMTYLQGKERSEKEWAKLFRDAGFTRYEISHALGVRSVVEVYP